MDKLTDAQRSEKPAAYVFNGHLLLFPCEVAPTNNPDTDPDYEPLYRAATDEPVFAYYDPTDDVFSRDKDSFKRGHTIWPLVRK